MENLLNLPTDRFDRTPGTPLGVQTTPMIMHAPVPKWLYVFNGATKQKRRYTLNTPSWAEGRCARPVRRCGDWTPKLPPQELESQGTYAPLTVREAMHLWVARSENKLGKDASTIGQYRHLEELVSGWARQHGIKYAQDITSYHLESWYASREWTDSLLRPESSGGRSYE